MAFVDKLTMVTCRRIFSIFPKTIAPFTKTVNFHTTVRDDNKATEVPRIIRIFQQALLTFDFRNKKFFMNNLNILKSLMDTIKAEDLSFDRTFYNPARWINKPPFTYIEVYQNNLINMSVFVMKPGYTMPLHDHPQMYGLVKVICGTVNLRGFTLSQTDNDLESQGGHKLFARMCHNKICNHKSETFVLTPTESNFHEIQALDAPSAFFDILSPPYGTQIEGVGPRRLGFYSVVNKLASNCVQLQQINPPANFYCDQAPYLGPSVAFWEMYRPSMG